MKKYIEKNLEYTKKLMKNINNERYNQLRVNRYVPIIKMIDPFINKDEAILDIGIREGAFLDVLKEFGFKKIYGLDIFEDGVKMANEKGYTCFLADVMELNLNMKFSTITMSHVLEHCPDIEKVLLNVYKHLNENGILFIEVPKEKHNFNSTKEYGHFYSFYKLKDLEDVFKNKKEWEILKIGKNPTGKRFKIIVRKK